jgi:hypothetical protein
MAFPKSLKELCSPALVYFLISILSIVIVFLQNLGNCDRYDIGAFSCSVPNTSMIFIIKLIYVLFWTWVLNLICKDGHTCISWLLIISPWILLFVILGLVMMK